MHKHGGVYADLDTWCLRPMDRLVTDNTVYLAEMSTDVDFSHNIPVRVLQLFSKMHLFIHLNMIDASCRMHGLHQAQGIHSGSFSQH